jgi:hypothetical protein
LSKSEVVSMSREYVSVSMFEEIKKKLYDTKSSYPVTKIFILTEILENG